MRAQHIGKGAHKHVPNHRSVRDEGKAATPGLRNAQEHVAVEVDPKPKVDTWQQNSLCDSWYILNACASPSFGRSPLCQRLSERENRAHSRRDWQHSAKICSSHLTIGEQKNKLFAVRFVPAGSLKHVIKTAVQTFPYVRATVGIQRVQSSVNLL